MDSESISDEEPTRNEGTSQGEEPVIDSAEIFQGTREVLIRHGNDVYRLIITRNNKLILNR